MILFHKLSYLGMILISLVILNTYSMTSESQKILNSINVPMQNLHQKLQDIGSSYEKNKEIINEVFSAPGDKTPLAEEILNELSRAMLHIMREKSTDILKSTTQESIGLRARSLRSLGTLNRAHLCQARNSIVAYSADLMNVLKLLETLTPAQQIELNVNYIKALNRQALSLYNFMAEIAGSCESK